MAIRIDIHPFTTNFNTWSGTVHCEAMLGSLGYNHYWVLIELSICWAISMSSSGNSQVEKTSPMIWFPFIILLFRHICTSKLLWVEQSVTLALQTWTWSSCLCWLMQIPSRDQRSRQRRLKRTVPGNQSVFHCVSCMTWSTRQRGFFSSCILSKCWLFSCSSCMQPNSFPIMPTPFACS